MFIQSMNLSLNLQRSLDGLLGCITSIRPFLTEVQHINVNCKLFSMEAAVTYLNAHAYSTYVKGKCGSLQFFVTNFLELEKFSHIKPHLFVKTP